MSKYKDKSSHPVISEETWELAKCSLSFCCLYMATFLKLVLILTIWTCKVPLYPEMLLICNPTAALVKLLTRLPYYALPHGQNCCCSQVNSHCECSMPWDSISGMFHRTRK